ncbi:MAG: hydantoinase/oxoprolinase family protein [Chloroflexi bacterium]|nr:hydantoinase/oxoprolinase family protein [Chloroflexota bacterium]
MNGPWRIGVDVGGTFTDGILWNQQTGVLAAAKVLSTPDDPSRAFLAAVGRLLAEADVAPDQVGYVAHGTTVATNAVLEGKLAPTGLITTAGFRDVFEIARQVRADPYDVFAEKPKPLVPRHLCLEVRERMVAEGIALAPLVEEDVRAAAAIFREAGVHAIAVCLLHSYRNPAHERRVGEILRVELPNIPVSLSAELVAEFREFPRACTAAINAGLRPVVSDYLRRIEEALASTGLQAELRVMQSNGGVLAFDVAAERPVHILESGPAAGLMGAAYLGEHLSTPNLIAFDMGGTSAKLGLIRGGQPQMVSQFEVNGEANQAREWFTGASGYPILTPAVDLVEIGAGGGSIAWVDSGGKLRVGPRSAGATPGPACYGLGGTDPTITDANLVLGRLNPDFFLGGEITLDVGAARRAVENIARRVGLDVVETALGIVEIANAAMVRAIRVISVQRGYDPRDFALVAFGGAGPLHAGALAAEMRIPRVVVQPRPGLASALGLLVTDLKHEYSVTRIERTDRTEVADLEQLLVELERQGRATLEREGVAPSAVQFARRLEMRYVGQSYQLTIPVPPACLEPAILADVVRAFNRAHEEAYGYAEPSEPTEIVNVRLTAIGPVEKPRPTPAPGAAGNGNGTAAAAIKATRPVFFKRVGFVDTPVYDRYGMQAGQRFAGPAIVEERDSTVVVDAGWRGSVDGQGNLILEQAGGVAGGSSS